MLLERFEQLLGERHWQRRVTAVKADIKGNPSLRDYLMVENSIAFALAHCSDMKKRFGQVPPQTLHDKGLYPAFRIMSQMLGMIDLSPSAQKQQHIRRLHGAFRNPEDMRALDFELSIATHFL